MSTYGSVKPCCKTMAVCMGIAVWHILKQIWIFRFCSNVKIIFHAKHQMEINMIDWCKLLQLLCSSYIQAMLFLSWNCFLHFGTMLLIYYGLVNLTWNLFIQTIYFLRGICNKIQPQHHKVHANGKWLCIFFCSHVVIMIYVGGAFLLHVSGAFFFSFVYTMNNSCQLQLMHGMFKEMGSLDNVNTVRSGHQCILVIALPHSFQALAWMWCRWRDN